MSVNLSILITKIKKKLGIYGLSLPLANADEEIAEHIRTETLDTFGQFWPAKQDMVLNLKDLDSVQEEYRESIYIIPNLFPDREILSIERVDPRSLLMSGGHYAPYVDSSPELYYTMMQAQANADLVSAAAPPFSFRFEEPNLLYLYNISTLYGEVRVRFNLSHARNLSTVKSSMYDTFYELALLDVKDFLYGFLKNYKTIETAYGTIVLEIDDWANASSEKRELVGKYRDTWHLEQEQFYII